MSIETKIESELQLCKEKSDKAWKINAATAAILMLLSYALGINAYLPIILTFIAFEIVSLSIYMKRCSDVIKFWNL